MKIGLLGYGTVGKGVAKIIDQKNTEDVAKLEIAKILAHTEAGLTDGRMTLDINNILNDESINVIVECIGGDEPAFTYVKKALEKGKHVVTSNKKMLAIHGQELFALAHKTNLALKYEASVGGGIPWLDSLDRTRRVDHIHHFRGIFNGTTNYILSKMSDEDKDFDEALKEAQMYGYAESDPSDDVDGYDTAYKVALSMVKGFDVIPDISSIITYGIGNISAKDIAYAKVHDRECKLIGTGIRQSQFVSGYVIPTFVRKCSLFATIPANFNAIESNSENLGSMTFVGQGAGSLPTAHAVVQNVIDIYRQQDLEIFEKSNVPVANQESFAQFYIRSKNIKLLMDNVDEVIDDHTCISKKMSYAELDILVKMLADDQLFVAEMADDCQ